MFKKIISFLMIFSFIFNSHLSEIIIFASEIDKDEVVQTIKNLVSDYEIEEGVFEGCSNLKAISIPNSIQSIGDYAFKDCEKLVSITIRERVNSLDKSVFEGCESLNSLVVLNDNLDGDFLDANKKKSIKYYGLKNSKLAQYANDRSYEFQEVSFYDKLSLKSKDIEINVGEQEEIHIESISKSSNEPITYISEDEKIATVDEEGNVKGLKIVCN